MMSLTSRVLRAAQCTTPVKSLVQFISTSHHPYLQAMRETLAKFEGGSVDLEMDEDSGIAIMTLNNPRRLNSMTGKMMVDMHDRVTELEGWKTGKGVILMGTNGAFCSGGDLTFVKKALDSKSGAMMASYQHKTLTRFLNLPLVSVALLQGHTLGGGAELATACDFRVMSSDAKMGFVQIKMGLTTGWGASTRLVHLLGRQKTIHLLTSGQILTAEEAAAEGLVDHVLSYALRQEEEVSQCKNWLMSNYCKFDANLTQSIKESVVFSDSTDNIEESLRNEQEVFSRYWGGPIQKAALAAKIKHVK